MELKDIIIRVDNPTYWGGLEHLEHNFKQYISDNWNRSNGWTEWTINGSPNFDIMTDRARGLICSAERILNNKMEMLQENELENNPNSRKYSKQYFREIERLSNEMLSALLSCLKFQ